MLENRVVMRKFVNVKNASRNTYYWGASATTTETATRTAKKQ